MKEKKINCKYCGGKLEAKTTRREFCSNKCKVYWHRELAANVVQEYSPMFHPTSAANIEKFNEAFKQSFDKQVNPPKENNAVSTKVMSDMERRIEELKQDYLNKKQKQ